MSESTVGKQPVYVVMVSSGTVIEYAPELYRSRSLALDEAQRWASLLSANLHQAVKQPFVDRWEVGDRDVRLVSADATDLDPTREWWVGTHWTPEGSSDPEAHLLAGKAVARQWVEEEPGQSMNELHETRWMISGSFGRDDNESYSVAHLAKACERLAQGQLELVEYEVELTGTFVQTISGTVIGPSGLSRDGIEALIDRNWAELSANTDVLLESSWELDSYRKL